MADMQPDQEPRNGTTDAVMIIGTILMCAGAAATAVLFAILVDALPTAAFKGIVFVALILIGSTLINVRLRGRLAEEGKAGSGWYTAFIFLTQFFLALAWVALVAAIVIMVRTG